MKISDHYQTSMVGAQNVGEKKRKELKAEEKKTEPSAVNVNISGKGQEVGRARSLALSAPDVRQGLVDEVTGQLANGGYDVKGEDVAPKMIEEHLALG